MLNVPENIKRHIAVVRRLRKHHLSLGPGEVRMLNYSRLEIATWVCHHEGIRATEHSLMQVLGPDASYAMPYIKAFMRQKCRSVENKSGRQ